jgi:hypothetical protein
MSTQPEYQQYACANPSRALNRCVSHADVRRTVRLLCVSSRATRTVHTPIPVLVTLEQRQGIGQVVDAHYLQSRKVPDSAASITLSG